VSNMTAKIQNHSHVDTAPDILKKIALTKKEEVEAARKKLPSLKSAAADASPALDFKGALRKKRLCVIAEIKKASPSAGLIAADFDPGKMADAYGKAGADAISVLTDEKYFQGSPKYLPLVRSILPQMPLLRKDFIIDGLQIYEARALGADSFLLIAALLELPAMVDMLELGRSLGMEALVEAHTEEELAHAIEAGALVLGVNSRNLRNFEVNLDVAVRLRGMMPEGIVSVAESGIKTPADAERLRACGYDAILVGESLMRGGAENCPAAMSALRGEQP